MIAGPPGHSQLLFWRPVPGFDPTPEAMVPAAEMVRLQRQALADAVATGQFGAGADSDDALWVTSVLISSVVGQATANEPCVPWDTGRFSPLLHKLLGALAIPQAKPLSVVIAPDQTAADPVHGGARPPRTSLWRQRRHRSPER